MNISKMVLSCLLCVLITGCGESEKEKRNRQIAEESRQRKIAFEKWQKEQDEQKKAQERVQKEQERKQQQLIEEMKRKEAQRLAEEEAKHKAFEAMIARKTSKSIYKMPAAERTRFNVFCGYEFGSTSADIPDVNPYDPKPFVKNVTPTGDLGVFSNAVAELVYTPVSKKLAYIRLYRIDKNTQFNPDDKSKVFDWLKEYYHLCFKEDDPNSSQYNLPYGKCYVRTEEQAKYDAGDDKCEEGKQPSDTCSIVDDKAFCVSYRFDSSSKVATYEAYAINTNLSALINLESKAVQESAIENESKNNSGTLKSFCGIAIGEKGWIDPDLGYTQWGYGKCFKYEPRYKNQCIEYFPIGQNAHKEVRVKCNKFRHFKGTANTYCSPISRNVFRIDILPDNELFSMLVQDKDLYESEFRKVISTLEEKYHVRSYNLTYANRFRITRDWYRRHKERLFVIGSTKLYLLDPCSASSNDGVEGAMTIVCIDDKQIREALKEDWDYREAMTTNGIDRLLIVSDGKISSVMGCAFGSTIERPNEIRKNIERHCLEWDEDISFGSAGGKFRNFRCKTAYMTPSSRKVFSILLTGLKEWGYFSNKEESANINKILQARLSVKPEESKIQDGTLYTYKVDDVLVEFRAKYWRLELEFKNLQLERQAKQEYDLKHNQEKKKIEAGENGASAL